MPSLTTPGARRATTPLAVAPAAHLAPKRRRRAYSETTVELARRRDSDAIVDERVAGILAARYRHHTTRVTRTNTRAV